MRVEPAEIPGEPQRESSEHECGKVARNEVMGVGRGTVSDRSGEFTPPYGGVKQPLYQTAPLPGSQLIGIATTRSV